MSYAVSILADSISPAGARITTFQLKYPLFIHQEFLTHRAISRNSSSSRAIPVAKMIEWVEQDPAMPVFWGKAQRGMAAREELTGEERHYAEVLWINDRDQALMRADKLAKIGAHKQIVNRLLAPFLHANTVATATDWDNFFRLRCHRDAQPEMQVLAVMMARTMRDSTPVWRRPDGYSANARWHLPYVTDDERLEYTIEAALKLSVARCARVSYAAFDDDSADLTERIMKDVTLHDRLQKDSHWSPFEHQGRPFGEGGLRSGNFRGWEQYRQRFATSNVPFDFSTLDQFGERGFLV